MAPARGFPDIPAHSVVVDPQRLYLGTDFGVGVDRRRPHVDDRRDGIWAGSDDVALADSHAGRTETVIRVYTWPRGVARHSSLKFSVHW